MELVIAESPEEATQLVRNHIKEHIKICMSCALRYRTESIDSLTQDWDEVPGAPLLRLCVSEGDFDCIQEAPTDLWIKKEGKCVLAIYTDSNWIHRDTYDRVAAAASKATPAELHISQENIH